jgi:RNA polymerase sigma-70 factor (ECF subfamily)
VIDLTDAELVGLALAGTDEPYAHLVARHRSRMMRYAARLLGSREDAEEVVQDSFVRAYRNLIQCANPERFGSWLFTILVNRCRTAAARRNGARVQFVGDEGVEGPGVPHPAEGAAWREEIQRALAVLPVDQREAFLLKHVEELSYEEMERVTGSSTPALKMRVKRACDRLREELTDVLRS